MAKVGDIIRTTQLRTLALVSEVFPRWGTNEVEYEVLPVGPDGHVIDPHEIPVTVHEEDLVEVVQEPKEREVCPEDLRETLRFHRLAWHHGRQPTRVPITAIANLEQLAQSHGHDTGLDALKRFEEMPDELVVKWVRLAPGYAWADDVPAPAPQGLAFGRELPAVEELSEPDEATGHPASERWDPRWRRSNSWESSVHP